MNKYNKKYISAWKDLGGTSLHFSPNGIIHPVTFINKLTDLLLEAEVPEDEQVSYVVNCLKGSAQDWAELKRFPSFEEFKDQVLSRYWSIEKEGDTFSKFRYGAYEDGSRADYFSKLIKESQPLSDRLEECETIKLCINHFSPEVRRGITNSGYRTLEDVERHLREVDSVDQQYSQRSKNTNQNYRNRGDQRPQNNGNWRRSNTADNNKNFNSRNSANVSCKKIRKSVITMLIARLLMI